MNARSVKALVIACLIAGVLTALGVPADAAPGDNSGKRVALVVGNSAYRFMPALQNPRNDAADVERTLKELGFETVLATDLDRAAMNAAVERFSRTVDGADIAVVYYSGHGMQFQGKNYLLPVEANLESAADVNRFRLMPVDDVIDVLAAARGLQLLVLDACRNNPIERDFKNRLASGPGGNRDTALSRGFSRIDARSGLIVTYATAPNDVASDGDGRNSPFTAAFLKNVATPDVDVRNMLFRVQNDVYVASGRKQLPEISSLYVGPDIRMRSSSPAAPREPQPTIAKLPEKFGSMDKPGPAQSVSVPQRVVLYDEDPSDPKGVQYIGTVIWRTETVKGPGGKEELALRGDIDIPDRKMKMTISLRRNTDAALPASHTAELKFTLPRDFVGGGIGNVPGVLLKSNEQARGTPLAALAVKVTDGFFLVGLSNVDAERTKNIQLLKERSWFDIPMVYSNQRRAIIAIEKGMPGERAILQAFAAWGE